MTRKTWKVGRLSQATGVSVRTLHHYDEVGLLHPSDRTGAGHRLYTADDVVRLQQVCSLRQMGFSLDEVGRFLDLPDCSPLEVLRMHAGRLEQQIDVERSLLKRLRTIADRLAESEHVSVEEFLRTIKEVTMSEQFSKYYTPEQLEQLAERRGVVGDQRICEVEAEWKELIEQVGAEMDKGTDPASETMQRLAQRWMGLVREFTGGDPGIERSLGNMYRKEPSVQNQYGHNLVPKMSAYVTKAVEASKKP